MLLSIIVPVYNCEDALDECIKSLLNQEIKDCEIILVNDGSIDNSKKICEKYKEKYEFVKLINLENGGVSRARNKGLEIAQGKYIAFVDSDDKVAKEIYSTLINKLESNQVDIAFCAYTEEFDTLSRVDTFDFEDGVMNNIDIKNKFIPSILSPINDNGKHQKLVFGSICRSVFKRDILEKYNIIFNENVSYSEDILFLLTYLSKIDKLYLTNQTYYFYNKKTKQGQSLTRKYVKSFEKKQDDLNKQILNIIKDFYNSEGKNWTLRKITSKYSAIINECSKKNEVNFLTRVKNIKNISNHIKISEYEKKLEKDEFIGLKSIVLKCIKYKMSAPIAIYFTYVSK